MPLIQGKSKPSFEKNLKTEMAAGKPQKQALAIAYAIKRKNAKKMAQGGQVVFSEQEGPEADQKEGYKEHQMKWGSDTPMTQEETDSLVEAIRGKRKMAMGGMCYAEGGAVDEEDPDVGGNEMLAMSESGDDFLTADEDVHAPKIGLPEDTYREEGPEMDPMARRKKILSSIMGDIRMKHFGKR